MKYLRIKLFHFLLKPFSNRARKSRMSLMADVFQLQEGEKIMDLGGHPDIWNFVNIPLSITILNLPGSHIVLPESTIHEFKFIEGDGCNVREFEDYSFSIVFSNSVIEHVGPMEKQKEFAREVRRLAERYWVQTPSICFPIEAHTGVPFWFLLPSIVKNIILSSWQKKLPAWTDMVMGTRVLSLRTMLGLFPEADFLIERKFFIPKSIIAVKKR